MGSYGPCFERVPRSGGCVTPQASPSTFAKRWSELCSFLEHWYYKPDTEGLLITLAVYRAHFLSGNPVWLAIIGPPGSGKTEIACGALEALPKVQAESALTTNSFLSGTSEKMGILPNLKDHNGVIVFPDFTTTILSIDEKMQTQISGQLRRIADGEFQKSVGNQEKQLRWEGKVTCIAAGTQDVEDFFDKNRDKGDRWIYLRWKAFLDTDTDLKGYAHKASEHADHKAKIKKEYRTLIYGLMKHGINTTKEVIQVDSAMVRQSNALAVMLEILRTGVKKEFRGGREGMVITGKGNMQAPTRTSQNFVSIARGVSALRGDTEVTAEDFALSRRVALDSIPGNRRKIIDILLQFKCEPVTKSELAMGAGLSRSTFDAVLAELRYLDIVTLIPQVDDGLIPLESDGEEPPDPNNPYVQRRPKGKDQIMLSSRIINLLTEGGL